MKDRGAGVPLVVGIGSNIAPEANTAAAVKALRESAAIVTVSPTYRSPAVGLEPGAEEFFNLAVRLDWPGTLTGFKSLLDAVEVERGRLPGLSKWASRTLDLDILISGSRQQTIGSSPVPHPDIERYAHVAVPLADVAGAVRHPRLNATYHDLAARLDRSALSLVVPGNTAGGRS